MTKTAFFDLRNTAKLQNMLAVSDAEQLVHAFMTSRLDYCNALLGGCPASSINKLQVVQNAAARVLTVRVMQGRRSEETGSSSEYTDFNHTIKKESNKEHSRQEIRGRTHYK